MEFTYYGHSCFLINTGTHRLLFDPFITHNELAKNIDTTKIEADYIFISHEKSNSNKNDSKETNGTSRS